VGGRKQQPRVRDTDEKVEEVEDTEEATLHR
jgi:hypothetical protein